MTNPLLFNLFWSRWLEFSITLTQYPAILTSCLVNNLYLLCTVVDTDTVSTKKWNCNHVCICILLFYLLLSLSLSSVSVSLLLLLLFLLFSGHESNKWNIFIWRGFARNRRGTGILYGILWRKVKVGNFVNCSIYTSCGTKCGHLLTIHKKCLFMESRVAQGGRTNWRVLFVFLLVNNHL